jgi:hypothetical protein
MTLARYDRSDVHPRVRRQGLSLPVPPRRVMYLPVAGKYLRLIHRPS